MLGFGLLCILDSPLHFINRGYLDWHVCYKYKGLPFYKGYLSRTLDMVFKVDLLKKITRIVTNLYFNFEIPRVRENRLKPNVQIKCLMSLRNRTPNWLGKISGRRIKTFMLSDYMMWIINQISYYKFDMQANVHQRLVCKTDLPLQRYRRCLSMEVTYGGTNISKEF